MSDAEHTTWVLDECVHQSEQHAVLALRSSRSTADWGILTISGNKAQEQARFIVTAVNSHDKLKADNAALIEALEAALRLNDLGYVQCEADFRGHIKTSDQNSKTIEQIKAQARAALAAAKGER